MNLDEFEGHTPGPWKIYYDKWNKTGWWIDSIARWDVGEGDAICQLHGIGMNKDPTAKLIAAAPDLLAEVNDLLAEVKRLHSIVDEQHTMLLSQAVTISNLNKIIEKHMVLKGDE